GLGALLYPTRLVQADYHSISVHAEATWAGGDSLGAGEAGAGARAGAGGRGSETILTLSHAQTVLGVFRARYSPFPDPTPGRRGSFRARSGDGAGRATEKEGKAPGAGDGAPWSLGSLLLPPDVVRRLRENGGSGVSGGMAGIRGCPVASRSSIHTLVPSWGQEEGRQRRGGIGAPIGQSSIGETDETNPYLNPDPNSYHEDSLLAGEGCLPQVCGPLGPQPQPQPGTTMEGNSRQRVDGSMGQEGEGTTWETSAAARGALGWGGGSQGVHVEVSAGVAEMEHFLAGRGGIRGVSVTHLMNHHPTAPASVVYLHPVPHVMSPLLSTLRGRLLQSSTDYAPGHGEDKGEGEGEGEGGGEGGGEGERRPWDSDGSSDSGSDSRGGALALLEGVLEIPPGHTLVVAFDFFKRFLPVDEFPPDPSRGLDIPPPMACFAFQLPDDPRQTASPGAGARAGAGAGARGYSYRFVYVHGEAALLDTPQPDFSMPFNVITVTSTAITFFLGTAINLLVRKTFQPKKKKEGNRQRGGGGGGGG
ncbi:unnamed protein product, partial [Discosporangium mesarthrocarpum]